MIFLSKNLLENIRVPGHTVPKKGLRVNGNLCGISILGSGIVSLLIALFVWRRRTVPETFWFALLAAAAGLWALPCALDNPYGPGSV